MKERELTQRETSLRNEFPEYNIKIEPADEVEVKDVTISDLFANETDSIECETAKRFNRWPVQIVREEAGLDEFVKEEPKFYSEYDTRNSDATKSNVFFDDANADKTTNALEIPSNTKNEKKSQNSQKNIQSGNNCSVLAQDDSKPVSTEAPSRTPIKPKIQSLKAAKSISRSVFECYMCKAPASSASNLKRHCGRFHGIKCFSCDICSRRFAVQCSLDIHRRWHAGAKPFKCKNCNREFATKNDLQRHNKTCNQMQNCNICGRTMELQSELVRHMEEHFAEKPFECDACPNKFATKRNLSRHKQLHTREGMFQCERCPKEYTTKWAKDNHQRINGHLD